MDTKLAHRRDCSLITVGGWLSHKGISTTRTDNRLVYRFGGEQISLNETDFGLTQYKVETNLGLPFSVAQLTARRGLSNREILANVANKVKKPVAELTMGDLTALEEKLLEPPMVDKELITFLDFVQSGKLEERQGVIVDGRAQVSYCLNFYPLGGVAESEGNLVFVVNRPGSEWDPEFRTAVSTIKRWLEQVKPEVPEVAKAAEACSPTAEQEALSVGTAPEEVAEVATFFCQMFNKDINNTANLKILEGKLPELQLTASEGRMLKGVLPRSEVTVEEALVEMANGLREKGFSFVTGELWTVCVLLILRKGQYTLTGTRGCKKLRPRRN